jgi:DNA-binding CsgD family transcriptional regulator
MSKKNSFSREDAQWLEGIELLATLPYPAPMLMPRLLQAIRTRIDAAFGGVGWVADERLRPTSYWSERLSEAAYRAYSRNLDEFLDELPLRMQLETDGEAMRALQHSEAFETHWYLNDILLPLGVRWAMGVPLFSQTGACTGFLYVFREASRKPFSDDEQARLRWVRDQMRALSVQASSVQTNTPLRSSQTVTLQFARDGAMVARSEHAEGVLYLCNEGRTGVLDWASPNVEALPAAIRNEFGQFIAGLTDRRSMASEVATSCGYFEVRAERLQRLAGGDTDTFVTIRHWEPVDLIVASRLLQSSLTLQEKRILIATAQQKEHKDIADSLGVTVGTLKSYVNRLLQKLDVDSREAIVDRLLSEKDAFGA